MVSWLIPRDSITQQECFATACLLKLSLAIEGIRGANQAQIGNGVNLGKKGKRRKQKGAWGVGLIVRGALSGFAGYRAVGGVKGIALRP